MLKLEADLPLSLRSLVEVLRSGSASSFALESLLGAINPSNAEHLRDLQIIDMEIFDAWMKGASVESADISARAKAGAVGLPDVVQLISHNLD